MNTLSLSLSLCLSPLSLSGFAHSHQQQQLHQQQQQQLQQQQQQHMSTVPSGTPTSNNGSTQMDLYPPPHITIKGESPTMMVMDTTQGSDSVRIWGTGRVLRGVWRERRGEIGEYGKEERGLWRGGESPTMMVIDNRVNERDWKPITIYIIVNTIEQYTIEQ